MTRKFFVRRAWPFVLLAYAISFDLCGIDVKQLLEQAHRPTIAQIAQLDPDEAKKLNPQGEKNQPRHPALKNTGSNRWDPNAWEKTLIAGTPKLIAQIEKIFPGATIAFLGRDTESHADAFEMFYESIGQSGRVLRIGMSKPTFWEMEGNNPGKLIVSDNEILTSLGSYGFDPFTSMPDQPLIIVDTLSKGGGRQGRVVLAAVYRMLGMAGVPPATLVRKFNALGLSTSTYSGQSGDAAAIEQRLVELEALYNAVPRDQWASFEYFNQPILALEPAANSFHESGYEHFVGAWHGRYGRYAEDWQGRLRAEPGPPTEKSIRKGIVWFQYKIHKKINKPEFLERVQDEARELGYEFPLRSESEDSSAVANSLDAQFDPLLELAGKLDIKTESNEKVFKKYHAELVSLVEGAEPAVNMPTLSALGLKLYAWLQEKGDDANAVAAFLFVLSVPIADQMLSPKDVQILLWEQLRVDQLNQAAANALFVLYRDYEVVRETIDAALSRSKNVQALNDIRAVAHTFYQNSPCEDKFKQ